MDLKRLRTFVVVAEQGTVSGAAKTLRITQPALSRQLQDLQAEFGVRLFDHVGRRLRLTAEGAELVPTCRNLLSQADHVLEHARSLAHGDSGELNVGAPPHLIASVFPGFLRQFAAKYPRVRVKIINAAGRTTRRGRLLGGKADGICRLPAAPSQTPSCLQSHRRLLVHAEGGGQRPRRRALASSGAGFLARGSRLMRRAA